MPAATRAAGSSGFAATRASASWRSSAGDAASANATTVATALAASPAEERERAEARVAANPEDPAALVAAGIARAGTGEAREARRAFLAAGLRAKDPSLAALAFYDLGVAALDDGDLEGALPAFYDAIALDPGLAEARFNLEWTLARLADETPPEPPQSSSDEPSPDEAEPEGEDEGDADPEGDREEGPQETPSDASDAEPSKPRLAPPPPLTDAEAEQWLSQIHDDPSRGLKDAVPDGGDLQEPRW